MICSKNFIIKPLIGKIVIKSKDDPTLTVTITEGNDYDKILTAYRTLGELTDKGHRTTAEVEYLGKTIRIATPHETPNRTWNPAL